MLESLNPAWNPLLLSASLTSGLLVYAPEKLQMILLGGFILYILYHKTNEKLLQNGIDYLLSIPASSVICFVGIAYMIYGSDNSFKVFLGFFYLILGFVMFNTSLYKLMDLKNGHFSS